MFNPTQLRYSLAIGQFGRRAATMSDHNNNLGIKIDQLTTLVVDRFSALDQRIQTMESEAAEIRGLLRAIVSGIERLHARMPGDYVEAAFDGEDVDDGFLTPPPGQFLH